MVFDQIRRNSLMPKISLLFISSSVTILTQRYFSVANLLNFTNTQNVFEIHKNSVLLFYNILIRIYDKKCFHIIFCLKSVLLSVANFHTQNVCISQKDNDK